MNEEKLKKQIEEINKRIGEGETIEVTLTGAEKSASLTVDTDGARRNTRERAKKINSAAGAGGTMLGVVEPPEAESFHLDLSEADDISDAQITEKIQQAVDLSRAKAGAAGDVAGDLPRVVLTRDENKRVWVLFEKCSYETAGHTITATAGYETDLASIPRVFWSILAPEELSLVAPLFHDLIYSRAGDLPEGELHQFDGTTFERKAVDDLFLELMTKAKIPRWKRSAAYWAVRGFAQFAWKKRR